MSAQVGQFPHKRLPKVFITDLVLNFAEANPNPKLVNTPAVLWLALSILKCRPESRASTHVHSSYNLYAATPINNGILNHSWVDRITLLQEIESRFFNWQCKSCVLTPRLLHHQKNTMQKGLHQSGIFCDNVRRQSCWVPVIENLEIKLTASSRLKMTTLPPLSPVARSSPSRLNSTHEIMSATIKHRTHTDT